MKKINLFKLLLVIGTISLSSCKKENNTIYVNNNSSNSSSIRLAENYTPPVGGVNVHYNYGQNAEFVTLNQSGSIGPYTYSTASDVVDAVANSVVEISTSTITNTYRGQSVSSGAGSGVILDDKGYIITNNHVIEDVTEMSVITRDNKSYVASLVATDEEADIAVIKINPGDDDLDYAIIGNSDNLRVAQDILVIGNPLGSLGGSVTKGIVSALDREVSIDNYTMNLLQIDAAVNPGNSGGALFDMNGYLVGIVNAKSTGEEIDGIGFAIPSNIAISTFNNLWQYGYVPGRTSVNFSVTYLSSVSTQNYMNFGINSIGLYISKNSSDNTFKVGDKIDSIDNYSFSSVAEFNYYIRSKNVGDTIVIKITRPTQSSRSWSYSNLTINYVLEEYIPSL